tara:strand:+ start:2495 stop:6436 length:3942 start_codon:yes stop_codon:yes gene_type:complete
MAKQPTNKFNYIEIINRMVPEYYRETDYALYGSEEDVSLTFLGNLLKAAVYNDLIFDVSTLSKNDIAEYFVPQGNTYVSPNVFQSKILKIYGLKFDDFKTKDELKSWVSSTLLPDTVVNEPSGFHSLLSGLAFGNYSTLGDTHEYLIDTLGMFYFMNTSSLVGAGGDLSATLVDYLVDPILSGVPAVDKHAINSLYRFFWNNRENSSFYGGFFAPQWRQSEADLSGNKYLSGTQMFEAIRLQLETWTDDRLKDNEFYKDSLNALLTTDGAFPSKLRDAGPFQRFLKAISLGIADINLILEEIGDLLSIDECPEQFLELLANNIGWQFLTGDYSKWRAQLRNAVLMYKTKGSVVGLEAACKLIFPDNIFKASDLKESWESYVPKMLYYLIKTESFIAKEGLEFSTKEDLFGGSWPEGVRFNQAPLGYQAAKDRNYRFLVDGILESFHNKFNAIKIGGKDFRTLPMWTCLPVNNRNKGFWHRNYPEDKNVSSVIPSPTTAFGFYVAVPPWEKYGFYKEVELSNSRIEYFCNILSGDRSDFGFEVKQEYVEGFKTLLVDALNSFYALEEPPAFSENNKFRVFTEGHQLPPNYSSFVQYGNASSLEDFDTWNTKGSFVFAVFNSSSIDYTVDGYDTFKNKAALKTYHDVLRDFLPLHAVIRLILYADLNDIHDIGEKLCIFPEACLDLYNTGYLRSYRTSFWAGASGTGVLGDVYVNGDGRVLPGPVTGTNNWWKVSASNLNRNTSRRRDYRYSLPCYPYNRNGLGQPIAANYFGLGESNANVNSNPYANSWEYVLKGFEYDLQEYVPMSSTVWDNSGFYDYENEVCPTPNLMSEINGEDYNLSSLWPVRAAGNTDFECSSLPVHRDTMRGILEVMTVRSIRDDKFFNYSDEKYRSFEFGNTLHESYSIYKNEFSGILKSSTIEDAYYGGFNFLSYAFGPTLWNNDFYYKGKILDNVVGASVGTPWCDGSIYGYDPQWKYVIGGNESEGVKYYSHRNKLVEINKPYFLIAPNATDDDPEQGVFRSYNLLTTREALSGIEIHQPYKNSQSFVVLNDSYYSGIGTSLESGVTLFNVDGSPLEVVFPFRPQDIGQPVYNKLRPQSQHKLDLFLRTQRNALTQNVRIELVTSGVTDSSGNTVEWKFSWLDQTWKTQDLSFNTNEFYFRTAVSAEEKCVLPYTTSFHTQDKRTLKSLPCGTPFKLDDVHTSATGYLLRISNDTVSNNKQATEDGLTLFEVSIMDINLNESMNDFNESEVDVIYTFWDGLSDGYYSRNSTLSAPTFEADGGSRAEYVELLGGGEFSSSSTVGSNDIFFYEVGD